MLPPPTQETSTNPGRLERSRPYANPWHPSRPNSDAGRDLAHADPPAFGGGPLDRFANRLHGCSLREVWLPWALGISLEEVAQMVDETGAIADALPDGPPVARVRVALVLGADGAHAVEPRAVGAVAKPQLIEPRIFEDERAPIAVHLDGEVARTSHGHAGHLEHAQRASLESDQGRRGIVDGHVLVRSPPHERRRLGAHLRDAARHPGRHVDEVASEVRDRGGAHGPVEAPVEWNRRVDELIRKPDRAHQADRADGTVVDHPLHERDRRQPA